MKPGIYPGLTMAEYLAMPAVSASLLKAVIDECPRAAWWRSWMNPKAPSKDATAASDAGTVAHACLLEGSIECVQVVDPKDHPTEKTGNIPDGWTNKSIRAARDAAIAAGKVPVFPEKMRVIEAMVAEARAFIESLRTSEPAIWAAFQPGGGESEVTMLAEIDGVLCRIRPDRISDDGRVVVDYKTGGTSAEPDAWGRTQLVRMGYYVSAALYRRVVEALCGTEPDYVFLVQEQEPPYLCSLVGVDPAGRDLGARKVARALSIWRRCVAAGEWPAYPTRVCYPEIPVFEFTREEAQIAHGIPYDPEKLYGRPPARQQLEDFVDQLPE